MEAKAPGDPNLTPPYESSRFKAGSAPPPIEVLTWSAEEPVEEKEARPRISATAVRDDACAPVAYLAGATPLSSNRGSSYVVEGTSPSSFQKRAAAASSPKPKKGLDAAKQMHEEMHQGLDENLRDQLLSRICTEMSKRSLQFN